MHEAKTKLSQLGEKAWKGERIIIAKAGKPYLELVPLRDAVHKRTPGRLAGQIRMAPDFDVTPAHIIAAFEGRD